MPMSASLLRRAIELYQVGEKEEANRILKAVLRVDPTNQIAWNWYIESLPGPEQRIQALEEYLLLNPNSRPALKALDSLKRQAAAQADIPGTAPLQPAPVATPELTKAPQPTTKATSTTTPAKTRRSPASASLIAVFSILFLIAISLYAFKVQGQRDTLQGQYENLQGDYTGLQVAHEVAVQEKDQLKTDLDELWIDYEYLNTAYKNLSKAYIDLEAKFNLLALDYIDLDSQHNGLLTDYSLLHGQYNELNSQYSALSTEYSDLVAHYTNLYGWYDWLQSNAVKPPYIAIHKDQVTLGFYGPLGKVETLTKDVSELEHAISAGENFRNNPSFISFEVNGEIITGHDLRKFVDPQAFSDYIPAMYQSSANDEAFIQNVWRVVSQLSDQPDEIFTTPRHPLETFIMGGGDSEDTSILLASMILAAPVDWEVQLVLMDADNPYAAQAINHVIVYINTGTKEYWLESSNSSEMLWPANIEGWYLDVSR